MPDKDVAKIISAGIVNAKFRAMLLNQNTRMEVINDGYLDEKFNLDDGEKKRFAELGNFETLSELAQALIIQEGNGTERKS